MHTEKDEITENDLDRLGPESEHYASRKGVDAVIRKLIAKQELMESEIANLRRELATKYSRGSRRS